MNVRRLRDVEATREEGPVFETQVHLKSGFSEAFDGDQRVSMGEVFFAPGERTTVHEHTIRQLLYVTGGEGLLVSADERHEVGVGDVISIPPGEAHWHGAAPNSTFSHVSVVIKDEEHDGTIVVKEPDGRRSE